MSMSESRVCRGRSTSGARTCSRCTGNSRGRVEILWGPEVYHYGMREFAIKDDNGYTLSFGEPTDDPTADGE